MDLVSIFEAACVFDARKQGDARLNPEHIYFYFLS